MDEKKVYIVKQNNNLGYHNLDQEQLKLIHNAVSIINPGDKVVIKPNFVRQCSIKSMEWEAVITHPVLICETIIAVIKRLGNKGEIVILDAPQEDSDFNRIIKNIGLNNIIDEIKKTTNISIVFYDVRVERKITCNGIIVKRIKQKGDPKGYKKVDLGVESCFTGKSNMNYYGADYNREEAKKYHNNIENSYVISGSVLDCDVFINMPKWKTHKIGGMTCCLKNAVGIIGIKNCIPHHTIGIPENNGDAYPKTSAKINTESGLKMFAHKILNYNIPCAGYFVAAAKFILSPFLGKPMHTIRSGHWYGNDTLWRAILDLNKIILYADKEGKMQDKQQRKYVSIIDGIVAGEKNGPMMPDAKPCGVLGVSFSPLLGDMAMCRLMGFDYKKIPSISNGFNLKKYPMNNGVDKSDLEIESNIADWNAKVLDIEYNNTLKFQPAFGWEGHVELDT